MKHIPAVLLFTFLGFIVDMMPVSGQGKRMVPFRDSLDGAFDLSYFLASVYGFLPFAVPVTEPAVGNK